MSYIIFYFGHWDTTGATDKNSTWFAWSHPKPHGMESITPKSQ